MVEPSETKTVVVGNPKIRVALPWGIWCPGCTYGHVVRLICEVFEEMGIDGQAVGLTGIGCATGAFNLFVDVDFSTTPHGRAPAVATAIKRLHPKAIVFTVQGDGDLGAIGLGCFMNALYRGEKLTTIFLNNGCFGTTGGQLAPTTPLGMRTTTTPQGRDPGTTGVPFHGAELVASIETVAFSARCSTHTPSAFRDAKKAMKKAFQKQVDGVGYGFIEMISACPTNWKKIGVDSLKHIEEVMLAEFPLGVFKDVDHIDYTRPKG